MGSKKDQDTKKTTKKLKEENVVSMPVVEEEKPVAVKEARVRGKRYTKARSKVDKTMLYSLNQAVELLKKTQFSKKNATVEVHLVLREEGISTDVTFPHTTGKTVKVSIATEEILKDLEKGIISFDILIAKPDMMPKLAKFARILGPKGLMPNPKNGTVSPNPEKRKAELEGGKTTIRSEKKAPLMHVVVGKTTQPETELVENIQTLIKSMPNGSVLKCTIASSMGPGIKVDFSSLL